MYIIYVFTFLGSLFLLTIGFYGFNNEIIQLKAGPVAEATIVDIKETTNSDGKKIYNAVLTYTDYNNEAITYHYNDFSASSKRIGDKVKILYDKTNYSQPLLLDYWQIFANSITAISLGLVLLLFSVGYFGVQYFVKRLPLSTQSHNAIQPL